MTHHPRLTYHRGITMHNLPVGGDIMGGLFALAIILIFLVGIPFGFWFLVGAAMLGALLSVFIFYWHRRHKVEIDDLSALKEPSDKAPKI